MSNVITTKGSIVNLSIREKALQFQIKPESGYKVTVDKVEYTIYIDQKNTPPTCTLEACESKYDLPNQREYIVLATYWMDKKTLLKFGFQDNKIISIEPCNDDKK